MKRIVSLYFLLGMATIGQPQSSGSAITKGSCSPANTGNNNTFNITCGIGKERGEELLKIVNKILTNQGESLKDFRVKLDEILKQLSGQGTHVAQNQSPGSAISINQSGGITAAQVNIIGPAPVKVTFAELSANVQQDGKDGVIYSSRFRVVLSGQVPKFTMSASAPTLIDFDAKSESGDAPSTQVSFGQSIPQVQVTQVIYLALGTYILTLRSKAPEHFQVQFGCEGVSCFRS